MKKVKILITYGPSLEEEKVLEKTLKIVDGVRFNFSHTTDEGLKKGVLAIRKIEKKLGKYITLLADTKGFELRTSNKKPIEIKSSVVLNLIKDIGVNHPAALKKIKKGQLVLIDDGKIKARVIDDNFNIKFIKGGTILLKRKINLPNLTIEEKSLRRENLRDFKKIAQYRFDIVALSFVRSGKDIEEARKIFSKYKYFPRVIAKIEHGLAVKNKEKIIEKSDGVMMARGDLALEVSFEKVPILQKKIVEMTKKENKLAIIATQMLESMIESLMPTRAEISDVANAVLDGADCLMLSAETSIGKYPLESIKTMEKIITATEKELEIKKFDLDLKDPKNLIIKNSIEISEKLSIPILAPTFFGETPFKLSSLKPKNLIYAVSRNLDTLRYLNLFFGIKPVLFKGKGFLINKLEKTKEELGLRKCLLVFKYPSNKKKNIVTFSISLAF